MRGATANFDYDALDENSSDAGASGDEPIHNMYAVLRTGVEWAAGDHELFGRCRKVNAQTVGYKLLVLLYSLDPTILGVESKEELMQLMHPHRPTRRYMEQLTMQLRLHLRKNREMFDVGTSKHTRATRPIPTPLKESLIKVSVSLVPSAVPNSRAVKCRKAFTPKSGRFDAFTVTFFTKMGLPA